MNKLCLSIVSCITFNLVTFSSFSVVAEKSHQQNYEAALGEQMQVKCYVEYQGGGNDIRFVAGSFKSPNQARQALLGRVAIKHNAQLKKVIHSVNECVIASEPFSKEKARQLDKVTAR